MLQYLPHLRAAGIDVEWHALLDDSYVRKIGTGERFPPRQLLRAYWDRFRQVRDSAGVDLLWVYGDLFPYLPEVIERAITGSGKPIVYDFDDAFFHHYDDSPNPIVRSTLSNKFPALLRSAAACCCGNDYLAEYASRHCPRTTILPTVVDTDIYVPSLSKRPGPRVIGWIGSPTTWPNVRPLIPLLRELCLGGQVCVRVVGAGRAAEVDRFPGLDLVEWNEASEVAEVQRMDIGIMPLVDRPFERGKSGYKLIQYMACGLPVIASPVGANCDIVTDGENGILASTDEEWRIALMRLLDDPGLRRQFGSRGREKVEAGYSLASQAPRLIELLRLAARGDSSAYARVPA